MTQAKYPLTREEFETIYSKVPRLCVDLIVVTPQGIVLSERVDPPAAGLWHLPGGTVYKGERLAQTAHRIAREELLLTPEDFNAPPQRLDVIEYDFSHEAGYTGFPVGVVYVLRTQKTPQLGRSAASLACFRTLPQNMIAEQKQFVEAWAKRYDEV